jgi:FAD/FMN-containing dehydrogenase
LKNSISFLATGGGHGYSTSLGRLTSGIDLDLSTFKTIQVDAAAQTMTIGGAAGSHQVASALQQAGMEISRSPLALASFFLRACKSQVSFIFPFSFSYFLFMPHVY